MLQANFGENFYNYSHSIITTENCLNTQRLKKLLNELGFSPVSIGTNYIIEELEYLHNTNISNINNLKQAYTISSVLHNVDIQNVQWNVESAIITMNRYANTNLLHKIFYWYDNYKNITPKYFINAMLDYLNDNEIIV